MLYILPLLLFIAGCGGGGGSSSSSSTPNNNTTNPTGTVYTVYYSEGTTIKKSTVLNGAVTNTNDVETNTGNPISVQEFTLSSNKYTIQKQVRYIVFISIGTERTIYYHDVTTATTTRVSSENNCVSIVGVVDANSTNNSTAQAKPNIYIVYLSGTFSFDLKVTKLDQPSTSQPATIAAGFTTSSLQMKTIPFSPIIFFKNDVGILKKVDLSTYSAGANLTSIQISATGDFVKTITTENDFAIFDENNVAYVTSDPNTILPDELKRAVISGSTVTLNTFFLANSPNDNIEVWGMLNSKVTFTVKTATDISLKVIPFNGGLVDDRETISAESVTLNSVQFTQGSIIWSVSYINSGIFFGSSLKFYVMDTGFQQRINLTGRELNDTFKPELIRTADSFHVLVREFDTSGNVYISMYREDGIDPRSYKYISNSSTPQIFSICPKSVLTWDTVVKQLFPDETSRIVFKEGTFIKSRDFNLLTTSEISVGSNPATVSTISSSKLWNYHSVTLGDSGTEADIVFFIADSTNSIVAVSSTASSKTVFGVNK